MDALYGACVSYVAGRAISIGVGPFGKSSVVHVVEGTTPLTILKECKGSAVVHKSLYVSMLTLSCLLF